MTPFDFVCSKLEAHRRAWERPQDQLVAALITDLLQEVARRSVRHYPEPHEREGIHSWRDQTLLLESEMLDWLIAFCISRFGDDQTTDQERIRATLVSRLGLYRDMSKDKAA